VHYHFCSNPHWSNRKSFRTAMSSANLSVTTRSKTTPPPDHCLPLRPVSPCSRGAEGSEHKMQCCSYTTVSDYIQSPASSGKVLWQCNLGCSGQWAMSSVLTYMMTTHSVLVWTNYKTAQCRAVFIGSILGWVTESNVTLLTLVMILWQTFMKA